jgi:dolichyl-phosphate beta-glucosyltransferase
VTERFAYVIPVHNGEFIVEECVERVTRYLSRWPESEVVLVENGSSDKSGERVRALRGSRHGVSVHALEIGKKGLGRAYRAGLEWLSRRSGSENLRVVLSAVDLPFAFTDLESARTALGAGESFELGVGSKLHPASEVIRGSDRRLFTLVFQALRAGLCGMVTKDSQGTLMGRLPDLVSIARQCRSQNFFFSTELICRAERSGRIVRELPVRLWQGPGRSTVRPFRDGAVMLLQLFLLRARLTRVGGS